MPTPDHPCLDYTAPILCVDLPAFDEKHDNQPFEITPCNDCLPWYIEIVDDPHFPKGIAVREWHAADCPTLNQAIQTICGDDTPEDR